MSRSMATVLVCAAWFGLLPTSPVQAAEPSDSGWVEMSYISGWGPCPSTRTCFDRWTVERASRMLRRTGAQGALNRQLSVQEMAQLDTWVARARQHAIDCPPSPIDVSDSLDIGYRHAPRFSQDVTGCAHSPDANPVKELRAWLSR